MKLRLLCILLFYYTTCFAQINVSLALEWRKESNPLNRRECIDIPYLKITYKNTSDSNYYFVPLLRPHATFPLFVSNVPFANRRLHWDKRIILSVSVIDSLKGACYSDCYSLLPGQLSWDGTIAISFEDQNDICSVINSDMVPYFLDEINYTLFSKKRREIKLTAKGFPFAKRDGRSGNEELNKTRVLRCKKYFFFLKAGETRSQSCNIYALQYIGGTFVLCEEGDLTFASYIFVAPDLPGLRLPVKVGTYDLFSEVVPVEPLVIQFENRE